MPTFEQIQSRTAGQPRQPSVAGAPPTPSMPNTTVTSPAPASAPIGRPQTPSFSGAGGAALPVASGAARPPLPGAQIRTAPPVQAQGGRSGNQQGAEQQQAQPVQPTVAMSRVPTRAELATLPPGTIVTTPYGEMTQDGNLIPSPEGMAAYQQAIVSKRQKFGPHPFTHDPSAPPPPIKLGRPSFNPFTGTWTEGD